MRIKYLAIMCISSLLIFLSISCVNKENKSGVEYADNMFIVDSLQVGQGDVEIIPETLKLLNETTKAASAEVNPNKIYEEKDVTRAICPQSDAEAIAFGIKHFKFPKPLPKINGTIFTDMIIEKDGSVSEVIIIDGLHPELDKETIRVLKLMPKFLPGKLNGQPVRSKYRMPMSISYHESK